MCVEVKWLLNKEKVQVKFRKVNCICSYTTYMYLVHVCVSYDRTESLLSLHGSLSLFIDVQPSLKKRKNALVTFDLHVHES